MYFRKLPKSLFRFPNIGMESTIVGCIEICQHSKRECIKIRKLGLAKGIQYIIENNISLFVSATEFISFCYCFGFVYFIVSCFIFDILFSIFQSKKVKDGNILEEVGTGVTSLASKVRLTYISF